MSKNKKYLQEVLKIQIKEGTITLKESLSESTKEEMPKEKKTKENSSPNIISQTQTAQTANESQDSKTKDTKKKVNSSAEKKPIEDKPQDIKIHQDVKSCKTINEIKKLLNTKEMLHESFFLNRFATNAVIGDGQENADILLIGEAPGEAEDESGVPFCGRSGQLLEKALISIGLSRDQNIYITNTVFWRPENNRKPTKEELEFCFPLLTQIIQIIKPKIIITSGSVSTELLLRDKNAISELMGKASEVEIKINSENKNFYCFPIYHPSYLLRNPISKKILWENLLRLKHFLQSQTITHSLAYIN